MFKVSFRNTKDGQSHTLQANDEHDKKQWVTNIKSVLKDHHSGSESGSPTNTSLFDPDVSKFSDMITCSFLVSIVYPVL